MKCSISDCNNEVFIHPNGKPVFECEEHLSQPVTEPVKEEEGGKQEFSNLELIKLWHDSAYEHAKGFRERDMETSALCSEAMGMAYKFCYDLIRDAALTSLQPNEKEETYTRSEVEGLLNKFCNEVMVGQAVGTIPKHSNGIAQYIIDNF